MADKIDFANGDVYQNGSHIGSASEVQRFADGRVYKDGEFIGKTASNEPTFHGSSGGGDVGPLGMLLAAVIVIVVFYFIIMSVKWPS